MKATEIDKEIIVGANTHEGMSGKHNEDSLGVFAWETSGRQKLIVGVVADGVGGQIAGEVASRLAVDSVKRYFDDLDDLDDLNRHLDEAIGAANQAVYDASQQNPQYRGMSTTVAISAVIDDKLFTSHVGDSRIYLFRDGNLKQISIDHTWAQEAIDAGLLTPEQAKTHPNRNVIRRHLGGSPQVEVDHRLALESGLSPEEALANQGMSVEPGDTLLICSDGLTDMISDDAVYQSLYANYQNLTKATNELIDKANQAGGKDNITVVILQIPPIKPLPPIVPAAAATEKISTTTTMERAAVTTMEVSKAAAAPAPEPEAADEGRGILFFLAGGFFAIVLVAVIAGIVFIFVINRDGEPTPPVETRPAVGPAGETTATQGAPATAAIFTAEATQDRLETAEPEVTPEDTPALLPTLRPTNTATATRIPPTPTPVPTETPTETPTTSSGGSGGPAPRPTNTAPPPPPGG